MGESYLVALQRAIAVFENSPDQLNTLKSYAFLGDPLSPFRPSVNAEVTSFVRKNGDPELFGADTTTAVGCPQGDQDEIVVFVAIDDEDVANPIPADGITISQPNSPERVFYGPLTADSAATLSDGFWRTTITVNAFGADSCGVDSALVKLYNMDLGYARFEVKSVDVNSTTPGIVNLPDLSVFAAHYPSSICDCIPGYWPYWSCVDWAGRDTVVALADYSLFACHWNHQYSPGGGGASPATQVIYSSGSIKLRFNEDYPLVGPRTLQGYVSLEGVEPFKVMFLSFKNENPIFRYTGWQGNPNFKGRLACVDVVRNGQKEIVLMVVGPKTLETREVELGAFELDVSSREPLRLTEDDFLVVTADILLQGGSAAMFGASQVDRSAAPVVFRNEMAQNYPNPFNPSTTIAFSIAKDSDVELVIYDVAGARVRTLANDRRVANNYRVVWDGKNDAGESVASGVYFYQLTAESFTTTKKMVLLR
jgi:hypothetical protein